MNTQGLEAVVGFGAVLMLILSFLYAGAVRAHKRGELGIDGVKVLRWAIAGQLAIYGMLAIAALVA